MPCSSFSSSLSRFVSQTESIANRLDFFEAVPDVEAKVRLEGYVSVLDRLWWDLYADTSAAGRDGVDVYRAAAIVRDELAQAVDAWDEDASLSPWRSCRDRVRDVLASMQASCDEIRAVDASAAAALRPRESAESPVEELSPEESCREKGGKGEKVIPMAAAEPATRTGRQIAAMLREHCATRVDDRVTRDYIVEVTGLSIDQVRRAIENDLSPRGIVRSKTGRAGGVWLDLGIAAADGIGKK